MTRRTRHAGTPIEAFTRMMFTRIITALARLLRDEALSIGQIAALHLVDQHGALRMAALAEQLGLSASATSRLAEGLVQRGLVARAEDPEDRRSKALTLTDEGREFLAQIGDDRVQVIQTAAKQLPKTLVGAIMAAVREHAAR